MMASKDARIKIMNEVLSGIKVRRFLVPHETYHTATISYVLVLLGNSAHF